MKTNWLIVYTAINRCIQIDLTISKALGFSYLFIDSYRRAIVAKRVPDLPTPAEQWITIGYLYLISSSNN